MKSIKTELQNGDVVYRNEAGQLHNENGAAIECTNGTKMYFRNGVECNEDGSALEFQMVDCVFVANDNRPAVTDEEYQKAD